MEEFPPNTHQVRREPEKMAEKKVERVTTGDVVRRKQPLGKRLAETFIGGDAKSVAGYVLFEVLIPAAKDTISDVVSQGIERMLFGEVRSGTRRGGYRPGGRSPQNGYVQYNKYSSSPTRSTDTSYGRDEARNPSRRARSQHDFDEIILATRAEAEEVIERLFDLVSQYESATVADLYELVGASANFTDDKWGWTDIRGAGVTKIRNGYLLDLPRPTTLD